MSAGLMRAIAAGHTVLAPNTELAAALFDAVERSFESAGRDIWPTPKIRDFGSWLREQYLLRQFADATQPRALSDVEERELWRDVLDASDHGRDFVDAGAAARAARRARRAMHEYGIPVSAIAQEGSDESQAFLDWIRGFDERCRLLGCISADALLESIDPARSPLTWIESSIWRPRARQWLARRGERLLPEAMTAADITPWHCASPAAELAGIAQWAHRNLAASPGFRAWVCVPDLNRRRGDVVDAFDAQLAPRRFALLADQIGAPYAVAGGTALSDYAPVSAALDVLAASLGSVEFQRFSALLRAPELQESAADAGAAAQLDVLLRPRAPSEADLEAWLTLAEQLARAQNLGAVTAVQRLRAVHRGLDELEGSHSLSVWGSMWIRALEAGPWALRSRWSSREYQAAERFRELLASLATADAILGTHSRESAQRILRRAARETAFQPQTGVPAIWVSGQLMDPWLNYQGLWVAGCNDVNWPPPVTPIPLLPVRLQREFGVISAGAQTQLQHAANLQSLWQVRAEHCVFSYADADDGRVSAPSPLLPPPAALVIPSLAGATPRPLWHAFFQSAPALERWSDDLGPRFGDGERTRGVATLKAQSRCAFRGFAETRLITPRLEVPVPGFNDRERGELVHHALEHIWSVMRDSGTLASLTSAAETELLEAGVVHALARVLRLRDPGSRWRQRERARMHSVLARWLAVERQRQPFVVETLEEKAQVARHAGLEFSVRVDRVDRLPDGARVLIDYKTGNATADWRGERPDNPQLPVYALLHPEGLVAVAYGRVNAVEPGFIAESERADILKPGRRRTSLEGRPSFAALVAVWSERIERLAGEFAAGRAEVAPTPAACTTCHLQGLCRIPAALADSGEFS